eukprot:gnl/TRDRNA2_/TRDRNA2_196792_c0_seq1.p1 gnl/TRDRNA2_/TRDRNA2_196792_c0~~gnl/TRDRNA2_/TRDRNA2_196792_c0_seq1.p1  ORF type:complete len:332 (-),score=33.89 gnl/TRDRNA2_/TRDRNA2_196792_c0_seq1:71-1066(-)
MHGALATRLGAVAWRCVPRGILAPQAFGVARGLCRSTIQMAGRKIPDTFGARELPEGPMAAVPEAGAAPGEVAEVTKPPRPDPISRRFALSNKPFFPIWTSNLRDSFKKKRRKKRGAGKRGRRGTRVRSMRGSRPHSRTWEGGTHPLFTRVPRWPEAHMRNKRKHLEPLNLSKLRYFIEKGRLDTRFPITQRHLYDCRCVSKIKRGVTLFNVNDFPFPYKIDIEVAGADQSSIDMIKAVGGTVTIVYMEKITLRAHLKPWKYEVLPRTARPKHVMVHYLEKYKARGAQVRYIKPLWLIDEERRLQKNIRELQGEDGNAVAERMTRENEQVL